MSVGQTGIFSGASEKRRLTGGRMKKVFIIFIAFIAALAILVSSALIYFSVKEYKPEDVETVDVKSAGEAPVFSGDTIKLLTFNTGYGALGMDADFFMDGGKGVNPESRTVVEENIEDIKNIISSVGADVVLLQEVDTYSKRSFRINQENYYKDALTYADSAYALNFSCDYVPYPFPSTIGKVNSGIFTLSAYEISSASRRSLPCPFSWPIRMFNLKRCMLVTYIPIADSDKFIVVINVHLEAYDDGEGKKEQTKALSEYMQYEYERGNYVIAGGDFNQTFEGTLDVYPITNEDKWKPGVLDMSEFPEGWKCVYDLSSPTCRLLDAPYNPETTQKYVIDGYIVSPNIEVEKVETLDFGFSVTDHNPVMLEMKLNK